VAGAQDSMRRPYWDVYWNIASTAKEDQYPQNSLFSLNEKYRESSKFRHNGQNVLLELM